MIKGQEISSLFTISDSTPGRVSVWMIVIMLFIIRLLYLAAYDSLEKYRYMRLQELKKKMELVLADSISEQMPDSAEQGKTAYREPAAPYISQSDEDKEAMELFDSLKHKKRW